MGQYLTIGGVTLGMDCAFFRIVRTGIVGGTGRLNKVRNAWYIDGYVKSTPGLSNSAAIALVDSQVVQVENAVRDGIDLVFSLGSTASLLSSRCMEGTHIREFSWTPGYDGVRGSGAEGVLRRTFKLVVYGDIPVTTDTDITSYSDSLMFLGNGGPNIVPVGSLTGTVQPQQTQRFTPIWIVQSGQATGFSETPAAATPQFLGVSNYEMPAGISLTYFTPRKWGINSNSEFGVRWHYRSWYSVYVPPYVPPTF